MVLVKSKEIQAGKGIVRRQLSKNGSQWISQIQLEC